MTVAKIDIPPPVPIMACWHPGPANGNDPCERDLVEVGDRLLVLIAVVSNRMSEPKTYWDAHVITATETGWDDPDGESWGAWDWSDVWWYMELTKSNMPQL